MKTPIALLTLGLAMLVGSTANAQFYGFGWGGYHHRSTAFGDYYSGAADLVYAQGQYLKAEAEAARTWVEASRGQAELDYQVAEWRQAAQEARTQALAAKADYFREKAKRLAADRQLAAQTLARDIQDGLPVWPAVLNRPEYEASVSLIASIIRAWGGPDKPLEASYRAVLMTELGVLENRVTQNQTLAYQERFDAVRMLHSLRELTHGSDNAEAAKLAMQ